YKPRNEQIRSIPVGFQRNGLAPVRLLQDQERMLLMFDHQTFIFDRTGQWLKTIDYPRGDQEAVYTDTTSGEGSMVWDQEQNIIYLVQGYRILALHLQTDTTEVVFQQNLANVGPIQLHEGRL